MNKSSTVEGKNNKNTLQLFEQGQCCQCQEPIHSQNISIYHKSKQIRIRAQQYRQPQILNLTNYFLRLEDSVNIIKINFSSYKTVNICTSTQNPAMSISTEWRNQSTPQCQPLTAETQTLIPIFFNLFMNHILLVGFFEGR